MGNDNRGPIGVRSRQLRQPILTLACHFIKIPRAILKRKNLRHSLSRHLPTTNQHCPLTTASFVHSTKPRWRLNTSSSPRETRFHKCSKNGKCRYTGAGRRRPRTTSRGRWDRWGYGRCCINRHWQVPYSIRPDLSLIASTYRRNRSWRWSQSSVHWRSARCTNRAHQRTGRRTGRCLSLESRESVKRSLISY